jgi:hypothetical protein
VSLIFSATLPILLSVRTLFFLRLPLTLIFWAAHRWPRGSRADMMSSFVCARVSLFEEQGRLDKL